MAKADAIEVVGTAAEPLSRMMFRVVLRNGSQVLAHVSGGMRHWIRILPGDRVKVEMSPGDPFRGRVTSRLA